MKHLPAFKAAVVAAAGILLGRLIPQYSQVFLSTGAAVMLITVTWAVLNRHRSAALTSVGAYLSLLLAFAFYMSVNISSLSEIHPGDYKLYSGTVDETPRDTTRASIILTDCFGSNDGWEKIRGDLVLTPSSTLPLQIGDRIVFRGKAGAVSAARNPGQFNLRNYYMLSGIAGRIYLRSKNDILALRRGTEFGFMRDFIHPVRSFIRDRITTFLSGDEAALARAMILGERMGINREMSEKFIRSGTIHILAVSGLHVGFITGILMTLVSLLRVPRRWRFFLISPALLFYALIVGLTPSVTRAVIMAIVILFGLFLQRKSRIINSLGFAALIILALSPSQLFSPGFQLSFAAVLSIAFFYERMVASVRKSYPALAERRVMNSVVSVSLLTFAATLGTVPLCAYYFERISLAGVFSNLLVVPLAGLFISFDFAFLTVSVVSSSLASLYAAAAQTTGSLILAVNSLVASFSMSSIRTNDFSMLFGFLYFLWLAAVFLFGKGSLPKKLVFAALLGTNLILYSNLAAARNEARLYVLDVGQGDAIYVELPDGRNMLIDSGLKFGKYDVGSRVVVPFLQRRGIESLDYFVITHLHSDHIGGAVSVLRSMKVRNFIYPDQISASRTWTETLAAVRALKIPARRVSAGAILDSDLVQRVYVLHPNKKYVGVTGSSYKTRFNDGSIVLKICVGGKSILLTGDAEHSVEHGLVRIYGRLLASEILKAGHHGSSTSSSQGFLDAVDAKYSVVSVGAGNRFGHPSPAVLDRMSRAGMYVWRTDSLNAACFRISPTSTEIVDWR